MEGYGLEKRYTEKIRLTQKKTSSPFTVYTVPFDTFHTEQETVSFRTPNLRGTPVLESQIDPYRNLLQPTGNPNWDPKNGQKLPYYIGEKEQDIGIIQDTGHAFRTRKRQVYTSARDVYTWNSGEQRFANEAYAAGAQIASAHRSRMPFQFENGTFAFGKLPLINPQSDLTNYGKKAVIHVAPGYPEFTAFSAIGELLLGFPHFLGTSLEDLVPVKQVRKKGLTKAGKAASDEFLNYVFGIAPTVGDLAKLVQSMQTATTAIQFLYENSGHSIRRNMSFDMASRSEVFTTDQLSHQGTIECQSSAPMFGNNGSYYNVGGRVANNALVTTLTLSESRKVRFSGAFTRFVPIDARLGTSSAKFIAAYDSIIGFKPTFEQVWQLIPYSWLVDWFLDIQSSLTLMSRVRDDSLLINYGYVTGSTIRTAICETLIVPTPGRVPSFGRVRTVYTSSIKERVRANPYGFIEPGAVEITPLRLAILAAIGITRKSLN